MTCHWPCTDSEKFLPSTEHGVIIGRTVVGLIFWSALFVSGTVVRLEDGKGGTVVRLQDGKGGRVMRWEGAKGEGYFKLYLNILSYKTRQFSSFTSLQLQTPLYF